MSMNMSEPERSPEDIDPLAGKSISPMDSVERLLLQFELELESAWSKETTSDPEHWSIENPALGQCAVTALVVQDIFGGELLWAEAALPDGTAVSHYFNKLDSGREVDLTRKQFPEGTVVPEGQPKAKEFSSTREYVLSYPVTAQRYERLVEAINNQSGS